MSAIIGKKGSQEADTQYAKIAISGLVEENYEGYFLDNSNYTLGEVLQDQECVYQSIQINGARDWSEASGSTISNLDTEQSGNKTRVLQKVGESSKVRRAKSQLETDEELARALQELENQLDDTSLSETTGNKSINGAVAAPDASVQAVREDNVDPDNMTYEELQSLGETIGTQSKGLSDELIAYLPSYKYKIGFFSKKDKHDDCVICYMTYKNRDVLTILPCQHQYHSKCVSRWLKLNKACPVCNEEVFGS